MVAEKAREGEEGQLEKSPSKNVAESLSYISRSSTFLPNIGETKAARDARSTTTVAEARLQAQFEATLQAERHEAARKQEELKNRFELSKPHLKRTRT